MRQMLVLPVILALSLPGSAQEAAPDEAPGLMERGAEMFLRGLLSEVEPTLDEMDRALRELEPQLRAMEPALRDLVAMMEDIGNYEAPVRLPNGDILIRRKPEAKPLPPPGTAPDGSIDL